MQYAESTEAVSFSFCKVLPRNMLFLRALPIARPVPSPNCPLTAVCKLTSGTRPRDAGITLRGAAAADGRGKLSHSEVHRFISGRRPCPGSVRHSRWLACWSHVVSDDLRGGAGGGAPRGGGTGACAGGAGAPRACAKRARRRRTVFCKTGRKSAIL